MASLPPAAKYEPGIIVAGKYRLERKLGEGGMGSVWAAHHVALDTAVALKVIRSDTNRQELAPRLLQEARAAAKLGHPAIVRVFDVGQTADGDPFIVMELLEGENLNQRLARERRLSATDAVQLLLPIADALRSAHQKGIVHRDIKPDNVFLVAETTGVQPKLVDFGIAKLVVREFDSQLTQRGAIVGSPDYMPPEQARGDEDIDQRADIWSFCVMLYETMTGRPPFEGANYNALMRAILESTPPLLTALHAADAELAAVVQTGLAKDRAERWQSMQELGEALARWLQRHGVFEDAAGGSIEARWLSRRTEPGYRQSQPSLGSIPGYATTTRDGAQPRSVSTERRLAAEAPTSFGPVSTKSPAGAKKRLLVPAGVALLAALALRIFWPSSATPEAKLAHPAGSVALAAAPSALPSVTVVPLAPAPTAEASAAPATTPTAAAVTSAPLPKSSPNRSRTGRAAAAAPPATSKPAGKPALDLLTPY